ncbi:MAG: type II toxin-antitoxin system VapC family toxin [Deltaproteobacteria bacterium]|nr:type II toxin-antitoxin system VapC family toxin [Deltaproteobacteria bacterium]
MSHYIDTSVLAAYYCPEPLSLVVEQVIRKLNRPALSALVELELYSAVSLKVRQRELDLAAANRIVSELSIHLAGGLYRTVLIEAREYALARDWIGKFSTSLRALDALHLAAAFANDLVILTADKAMAKSAKHLGVKHRLLS